ncbi:hypothetical protein EN827_24260 [Mesorhizobium sp. M1D.F.Ca.ET.184.01.1.1]|nr:hypothetical protein EN874_025885 [Mesorhizobium sp. M1D.F.Ca.ET.231.01.1.1]TGP27693.1 hypothetical protein EN877_25175 [Mesorhizobium sp. M1D.F.Ca.ET.234.01.1.1]TGS42043.1 hypothetical protein EN827_24260 [Mesorhizobium sp. M1D.F.Ca.ET.184.01.1.1]TGS59395.1 hypothetical protein EN826_024260 [Mesorhizobium sp. M1D.F.Ca.ET.183.01.1.1]
MQLIERDALARAGGRIEPDRTADEAELEVTFPTCPGRHDELLRGHALTFWLEHDLVQKPVPTFWDHALCSASRSRTVGAMEILHRPLMIPANP